MHGFGSGINLFFFFFGHVCCCLCPHGLLQQTVAHDPALAALATLCDAVWGAHRVLADLPGRKTALDQWWTTTGQAQLHHRPDLVLVDFYGRGTFLLLDVKTFDPAGATALATHHTSRVRGAAHLAKERECRVTEFRDTPDSPLPRAFRLVVFTVSTFGALGGPALRFLSALGKRAGRSLPVALLPQATWAVPAFAPFARMAVTFAVRRGLAERLTDRWSPAARAAGAWVRRRGGAGGDLP